jgi:hypothetical protein
MARELYRDEFGVLPHDKEAGVLTLEWSEGSTGMSDEDFMGWLSRYAAAEEEVRAQHLVIDVQEVRVQPRCGRRSVA